MKIAYILPSLTQAGNVCVVKDLATVMCEHGHTCTIYYFDDKVPGYNFPCETKLISFKDSIPFNEYDIIHTHSFRPDIYSFIRMPYHCNAHMVCTIHNYVFEDMVDYKGKIVGYVAGFIWQLSRIRNERIIVLSKAHFNYYSHWFPQRILRIAYNTRILDQTAEIPNEDKKIFSSLREKFEVICGSICQISDRKGLDQIIFSLKHLDSNICYVVIGDGPKLEKLLTIVNDEHLHDRVFFMGNRKDGYRYLPYIDIFCIPSHSEGFPLAMLEAAYFGKAIVSSDIPVFKEIFNYDECVICRENDIDSMANGIRYAIAHKKQLGDKARARFEREYSDATFYKTHYDIYRQLLDQ